MKAKLYIVLCLAVVATFAIIATSHKVSAFSGSGSGTVGDPYVITNVNQLQDMQDNLTAYYILGNDIDASATTGWNAGAGFVPVGTQANPFTGNLNGRGHRITSLYINRLTESYVGLFGAASADIENIGLENIYVTAWFRLGGLVGFLTGGTITTCYSTGNIQGHTPVGAAAGGLVGELTVGTTIVNSYSVCSVSGQDEVGGLAGWLEGTVSNSYSSGSVSGGGVNVGGLIGGNNGGTVLNSFWDNQTSNQSSSAGGTGKTTDNMKNVRTFTDNTWSAGLTTPWDFVGNPYNDTANENIWDINKPHNTQNGGYPILTTLGAFKNTLPTAPTTLTLTNPIKVGQVLTATASGSTDLDNDNIVYLYRFYNQTVGLERHAYSTTNTYTIQVADAHDNIRVFTKASDSYEYSSENENSIIVGNSLPVAGLMAPDNGATGTSITPLLDWTFADNDGDTQVRYWVVVDNDNDFSSPVENTGQVTSSATIYAVPAPLAYLTKYYWEVKVYDGYEWSIWYGVWNFTTGASSNLPPNKPTNLLPSARQTTINVALSCIVVDNDVNPINVYFYDNSDNSLIDNIWIASGATAHVTWGSRTRGQTYAFFTQGEDNNGAWGDNSNIQSFKVNLVPTCSISLSTTTPTAGDNVSFMSNASDGDNDNLTYAWDFGDGSTSNLANPSHSYSAGNYTVTLYVNDGYENSTTDNVAITVHTPPTPTGGGGQAGFLLLLIKS